MFIVKVNKFYIKVVDDKFVCGQFNVPGSESEKTDLINAMRDLHSRMLLGYYNTDPVKNLKAAIDKSDENIRIAADKLLRQ